MTSEHLVAVIVLSGSVSILFLCLGFEIGRLTVDDNWKTGMMAAAAAIGAVVCFIIALVFVEPESMRPIGSVLLQTHGNGGLTYYKTKEECAKALVQVMEDEKKSNAATDITGFKVTCL